MLNKILFAALLLLCISCQSEQDKKAVNIGNDICTCFQPLVAVNAEIQSMIKSGENDKAETLIKKVEEVNAEGNQCAGDLIEKYGANTSINTDKISEQMESKCPKIHRLVKEGLFGLK